MTNYEKIIEKLERKNETISTMESATGGAIAYTITNYPHASHVFKYGAVTYSNEFKIKMGVDASIIDKYTVYSYETAKEMSKKISDYTNSDYGVGITGKMGRIDEANPYGDDSVIFISVYDRKKDTYTVDEVAATKDNRVENKDIVIQKVGSMLVDII